MVPYLILILILVLIAVAMQYFGVFDVVLPHLVDAQGPYGLSEGFVVNLSSDVVLVVTQVLFAFLIFEIVASGRARRQRKIARKKFIEILTSHYREHLKFRTSAPGPVPGREGLDFRRRHDDMQRIMYRWLPFITPEDESRAIEIDRFFEQLVFEQTALVKGEFKNRLIGLQFRMGLRRLRRQELAEQLKADINRFVETRLEQG